MRYPQILEGEWIQPCRQGYTLACCQCGLVHSVDFKLARHVDGRGRVILFRCVVDHRRTGQIRRWMKARAQA